MYMKTQNIMIEAGVKQCDPISPTLFSTCLEGIIRRHQTRKTCYNCVGNVVLHSPMILTIKKGSVDQYAKIKIHGKPIRTMSDTYKYLRNLMC
ncbi:hypothetical protein CRE_07865 [Caenorhabditis remanei]|uniref:Uncharacterized protein n=1 Tax=Caenorhabditis remanei TaxID=31234 RepID=E3NJH1_CAERE|nr:hypothetical protein CRE_07865 [Caenorhabditis remanei]